MRTPERWKRLDEIYHAALACEAAERPAFVDGACGGDSDLRSEVLSLLARASRADDFLEAPAPLAHGTRFGEYEIDELIGSGGMGEVYRARDSRLGRQVAIKVLPEAFTRDPERRARFDREAHVLATLNHPHIGAIYGVEDVGARRGLILELVDGATLADRLRRGALPLPNALTIASQIADALAAAHERGIVHRDLKPANIKLTSEGMVKVLDFGLAKFQPNEPSGPNLSQSPTISAPQTRDGVLLGTAAYMSPEQARGHPVDARADIWAFGCVLYEMLSGRCAFDGESVTDTLAAIIERDPDWERLGDATSGAIRRLLRRCLAKDPRARIRDIVDVRLEIDDALRDPVEDLHPLSTRDDRASKGVGWWSSARVLPRAALAWAGVAIVLAAVTGGLVLRPTSAAPARSIQRTVLPLGGLGIEMTGAVAISPDERVIAFTARDAEGWRIFVRRLDAWDAHPLSGTEGVVPTTLCFSPDAEWIAFVTMQDGQASVRRVPTTGGAAQLIASGRGGGGIRCTSDGHILAAREASPVGIWSIAPGGGEPQILVQAQETGRPGRYSSPEMLPGGRAILFTIRWQGHASIVGFSLDRRKLVPLIESGIRPRYLADMRQIVYQSDGRLLAVPFDPDELKLTGEARIVADRVGNGSWDTGEYDISQNGVLVYLPSSAARLVWRDVAGATTPVPLKERSYQSVALAPDGAHAVVNVEEGVAMRVYLADLVTGEPLTRLTAGDDDWFGLFTRDGTRVLFTSGDGARYNIFSTRADGGGDVKRLTNSPHWQQATSIWSKGPVVLFSDAGDGRPADILQLDMDRARDTVRPVVQTLAADVHGVFSPDGRWIAYEQTTAGAQEVYVQAYPAGPRTQVSVDGGWRPMWNPNGRELFFASSAGLMKVGVEKGIRRGPPVRLFERGAWLGPPVPGWGPEWDVSPDGRRFLMIEPLPAREIDVVFNWYDELKPQTRTTR
jgi:serine/threonine protein kinase/Tol biopolymer transport system component